MFSEQCTDLRMQISILSTELQLYISSYAKTVLCLTFLQAAI